MRTFYLLRGDDAEQINSWTGTVWDDAEAPDDQEVSITDEEFTTKFRSELMANLPPNTTFWEAGIEYLIGTQVLYKGVLYRVILTHTAAAGSPPGTPTEVEVYRPLNEYDEETGDSPLGSKNDPIPFMPGMDVIRMKHYLYQDIVFIARDDIIPCPDAPNPESGLWVVYVPCDNPHAGTSEDPIPFGRGMNVHAGKIYIYKDMVWIARDNMFPCNHVPGEAIWSKLVYKWKTGVFYPAGQFVHTDTGVYQVVQSHTSQALQPPGSPGMLAIYRPIGADPETGEEPDGSREQPIPFSNGMDVVSGLHYSHNGTIYLAKADMPACVWDPGTAGLWQWEAVG